MDYYPVFMNLRGRRVLVVGGGEVAARKVDLVHSAGARVVVVAPCLGEELRARLARGEIQHVGRRWVAGDVAGSALVIAATDDPGVHECISVYCQRLGIPVNVVDDTPLCSVITPAMVDRSPIQIAISSGGVAPVLARRLRAWIEAAVPPGYGRLARLAARFRSAVKTRFASVDERRKFWERILEGPVADLVYAGRDADAAARLTREIEARDAGGEAGSVALVGAGPGDPDLLTFRALRLMQHADVVLYDRLVSDAVLELTRRDAEKIYVGKRRSNHHLTQDRINAELIRLARAGKRVVRLKGGDPFIFGRGGEEIGELMDAGIDFQVVPGITAAAGCAAYAGIPLTHRDHAQSVQFITAHLRDGTVDLDWPALVRPGTTLAVYMGLSGVRELCARLIEHGRGADTPAALVQQGTLPEQRVFVGSLASLPGLIEAHEVQAPTLIIVGDVVRLHRQLQWYRPEEKIEAADAPAGDDAPGVPIPAQPASMPVTMVG
jgi:uroporphyrin-III C-methyltransferase/precorrin-2 dehydrogenase/sirohydrochlorin ferrochelatase